MGQKGEIRYKVECRACGQIFIVSSTSSPLPKHHPKGEHVEPDVPYVPCVGSGWAGYLIDTVI